MHKNCASSFGRGGSDAAALVLAAGFSSRMGALKALLPLGPSSMLGAAVAALESAGVGDIRVVCGFARRALAAEARRLGVKALFNPDYRRGMFSSVRAGLAHFWPAALSEKRRKRIQLPGAVLIMPVDAALVSGRSVAGLLEAWRELEPDRRQDALIVPVHAGRCGHPVLLGARHALAVANGAGEGEDGGLRAYLASFLDDEGERALFMRGLAAMRGRAAGLFFLPLDDPGLLADIDTPEDYAAALKIYAARGGRTAEPGGRTIADARE